LCIISLHCFQSMHRLQVYFLLVTRLLFHFQSRSNTVASLFEPLNIIVCVRLFSNTKQMTLIQSIHINANCDYALSSLSLAASALSKASASKPFTLNSIPATISLMSKVFPLTTTAATDLGSPKTPVV